MLQFFCLGDQDTCAGFRLAGVSGETPQSTGEAAEIFDRLLQDDGIGILIITETVAAGLSARISEHRLSGRMPMVVEIPENLSGEFSGQSLMDSIKQAIGINI